MNEEEIKKLIDILQSPLEFKNDRALIDSSYRNNIPSFINYEEEREGIKIDYLQQKNVTIFKNIGDFKKIINESYIENTIIIVEEKLHNLNKKLIEIEKVKYTWNLLKILKNICDYDDVHSNKLIFITEKKGVDDIIYKSNSFNFEVKEKFEIVNELERYIKTDKDFISFFKNQIISVLSNTEEDKRFQELQLQLPLIFKNSKRDFNLFKSKFGFENFKKGLAKQKEEYINFANNFTSEFSQKIGGLTIEFGALIFFITRKYESQPFFINFLSLILLIAWFFFRYKNINHQKSNIVYFQNKINNEFEIIKKKAKQDIEKDKTEINKKIDKDLKMINCLKFYLCITSIVMGIFIIVKDLELITNFTKCIFKILNL